MKIHDLARHLNVSIGTVSRALNGRAEVSEETRRRVIAAADRLGYSPNQSGRSLRRGATGMAGFMILANRARARTGEAFFMAVFEGLQSALARRGLDLVIYYCGADQDQETFAKRVVERGLVDGLIVSQTTLIDRRIDYLIRRRLPFIAFGRSRSGGAHSWIDLDFEGAAEQAIGLLYERGHRRIAVATAEGDINLGHLYLEACRAALARRGIRLENELICREEVSEAGGHRVGERLLACRSRPTAVTLVENSMAIGLYAKLREVGLTPGKDIAVVGFEQSPTSSLYLKPSLTQFRVSPGELGNWLGEHLSALIEARRSGKPIAPARRIWPMEIVPGESADMWLSWARGEEE